MRILHVTECYDGGVSRAIDTLAQVASNHKHFLLFAGGEDPSRVGAYTDVARLSAQAIKRGSDVRKAAATWEVDVIHAHSSWAGVYTRLVPPPRPTVYQPHCFVFDDPGRSTILRFLYFAAETLLARNSTVLVALTQHEMRLAAKLRSRAGLMHLVNTPTIDHASVEPSVAGREIVMVGRLCPQKDPQFYFDVSELVRSADSSVRFTWIGDGDDRFRSLMSSAGIEVTGWLEKAALTERLARASVYLHSASYEGFPLSVLDAAAMDLPIVLRDIDCFEGIELQKVGHPREAAALILRLLDEPELFALVRAQNKVLLNSMNVEVQRVNLNEIYEFARTKGAKSA